MIKKGIVITAIFILSNIIQLISQIAVTRIFGAKLDLDIFLAAVAIPTIIVTVIYGTLNDAFLPLYGEQKNKNAGAADNYFISHVLILGLLSFLLAWILGFFSQPLSHFLYADRGADFVKNVGIQMSFMFYSIPFSVVATIFGSYFYLHKKFSRFPIAQAIGSLVNLVLIIILAPIMGIWALVFAFVINILIQIFFVIPPRKIFNLDIGNWKLDIRNLLTAWLPLIIANFALRSDNLIIRSFGAGLPTGYLVYLNLISKMFALATGVMTIGIQILQLPHLVEYFSQKKYPEAIAVINKSKISAIIISVLITVLILLVSPVVINFLFVGGKFSQHDANVTISLIPFFVLPAIGWGLSSVFFQPLIALKKQFLLGIINVTALILAWIIAIVAKIYFGPMAAISSGLIILLFTGIIGSELLWRHYKNTLLDNEKSADL